MDDLHGPLYRLRGAEHIVGLPPRFDGRAWELWVGGGTILAVRPESRGGGGGGAWGDADPPAIDCGGLTVLPGLVDLHVHCAGDCSEVGGYLDRTPEATLPDLLNAGVTTFVGVLGRDTVSRSPRALLAKARGLKRAGGLTALVCTGAGDGSWPPPSLTGGGVGADLALVDEAVGLGHFAVSDPRSPAAHLAPDQLARAAGEVLSAAALAAKVRGVKPGTLDPPPPLGFSLLVSSSWCLSSQPIATT